MDPQNDIDGEYYVIAGCQVSMDIQDPNPDEKTGLYTATTAIKHFVGWKEVTELSKERTY